MNQYEFSRLNYTEFEAVSIDTLGALLPLQPEQRIERFKPGKDGGVDGRFFTPDGAETVIQCKHYLGSGLKALLRDLNNKELPKVKKLNPSRYIIVTSLPLSRANKAAIKRIFKPYIKTDADVFSQEDLNHLIAKNPEIERNHFKLWLSSVSVISTILNRSLIEKNRGRLEEIIKRAHIYAPVENHEKAWKVLEELYVLIIRGEAGAGKTALAEHLCLLYSRDGFEICFVDDGDISNAEQIYKQKEKQVYFLDDFFGRTMLSILNAREDSQIVRFINRVIRDPLKRLIVTSRTVILHKAKARIDQFEINNFAQYEFEVTTQELTRMDRARILYNHIHYSSLNSEYNDVFWDEQFYRNIIDHPNFNPRLVSFLVDAVKTRNILPEEFRNYILEALEKPFSIWENVFENQLDETSKLLACIVGLNGSEISEEDLKIAYYSFPRSHQSQLPPNINQAIIAAVGTTLIRRFYAMENETHYDVFNPGLTDYIMVRFQNEVSFLEKVFLALNTIPSLDFVLSLTGGNEKLFTKLAKTLVKIKLNNPDLPQLYRNWLAFVAWFAIDRDPEVSVYLKTFLSEPLEGLWKTNKDTRQITSLLFWGLVNVPERFSTSTGKSELKSCLTGLISRGDDSEDFALLSNLIECIQEMDFDKGFSDFMRRRLKYKMSNFWKKNLKWFMINHEFLDEYDDPGQKHLAIEEVEKRLEIELNKSLPLFTRTEISNIAEHFDFDAVLEDNRDRLVQKSSPHLFYDQFERDLIDVNKQIDDLFYGE